MAVVRIRMSRPAVSVLMVIAAVGAVRPAGQTGGTFRSGVRTVSIYATVEHEDGHLVPNLAATDFEVLDNGKNRPVTFFSSERIPITVAVMLDTSNSVAGMLPLLQAGAHRFVAALLDADRAAIGSFGSEIAMSPVLTDHAELSRRLREEIWAGGGTPLWNAIDAAIDSLQDEHGRRVILVFTDGINNTRWSRLDRELSALSVLHRASRAGFMVYAIRAPRPDGWDDPKRDFADPLLTLVRETGGGYFDVRRGIDLGAAFTRVAEELHHQYIIGFSPASMDGTTHRLQIKVKHRRMKVRARTSYVAAPE